MARVKGKDDRDLEKQILAKLRPTAARLRAELAEIELLAAGTLQTRTKACGRKGCHCALAPEHRHGPYFEWNRWRDGKLVHSVISAAQAELVRTAIDNYRRAQRILADWVQETEELLLAARPRNRPK